MASRAKVGGARLKARARAVRAAKGLADAERLLASSARSQRERLSVLRRLHALSGKTRSFSSRERNQLVGDVAKSLESSGSALQPEHFGCKDWRELAEMMVGHFERIDSLSARNFRAFSSAETLKGHESALRGKLFNTFVRNFKPFWRDVTAAAKWSVQQLNDYLRRPAAQGKGARLVNAKGEAVLDSGAFSGDVKRGREVVIVLRKKGAKDEVFERESVDDVLVTSARSQGGGRYWLFPIEVESKAPGAARGFAEQIAGAQVRFGDSEVVRIELTVDGSAERVIIPADRLVFDLLDSPRYAVSAFSDSRWRESLSVSERKELMAALADLDPKPVASLSEFRVQDTAKSGGLSFRRLDLALNISQINLMIRAAIRAGSTRP